MCFFLLGLYTFGYEIRGREHLDHWNNSVLLLHPSDSFNHSGHVHSWHFYANRTVNVTLQIWRPMTLEIHQYKLVGQNFYNISATGIQNVVVSPNSRIPFEEGDVIGVYFPSVNPIPFSKRTSNCSGPILYLHMTHPQLSRTYPFREREDGWNPCRVYSIHLQISNSSRYHFTLFARLQIFFGLNPPLLYIYVTCYCCFKNNITEDFSLKCLNDFIWTLKQNIIGVCHPNNI